MEKMIEYKNGEGDVITRPNTESMRKIMRKRGFIPSQPDSQPNTPAPQKQSNLNTKAPNPKVIVRKDAEAEKVEEKLPETIEAPEFAEMPKKEEVEKRAPGTPIEVKKVNKSDSPKSDIQNERPKRGNPNLRKN